RAAAVRGGDGARVPRRGPAGLRHRRAGMTGPSLLAAAMASRIAAVRDRIDRALARAGRAAGSVRLVAIAKRHPAATVAAAIRAGVADVGESYAQELVVKQAGVTDPVTWHFVGKLQRNKVKLVVGRVGLIHAVDTVELLDEIGRRASVAGVVQPILLAVSAA